MPAEEQQAIDVIEQGHVTRFDARLRCKPVIAAMAILTAVAGFLFSLRDAPDAGPAPPQITPPTQPSPAAQASPTRSAVRASEPLVNSGGFGWLEESGGMRFYIDMLNAAPTTIYIEKLRLPPSPGVTVTLSGIGNGDQGDPFTAPPLPSDGIQLRPGESTNLVLVVKLDCDIVATTPGTGPPFDITFTSAGRRLVQHFQPEQIPGGWLDWARKTTCSSSR